MNVILDTNIYAQDFLMSSTNFNLLLDYLKKTNSRILMPLIVYQELAEVYGRRLRARLLKYEQARGSLEELLNDAQVPHFETDISAEVARYLGFLERKLGIRQTDIVPYRENCLSELVNRAITRRKPFSDRGEEFRDALLWLTVLDIARETKEETLAFISNDKKAFGQNNQLSEALLEEASSTGITINFYNSIRDFIESHATRVEYVTRSWLSSAINFEAFEGTITERLQTLLERLDEYDLRRRGWEGLEFTGYLSPTDGVTDENLTDYYVYEKSDGSLYIEAYYYIEYEVEFSSTERARRDTLRSWETCDYGYDYDLDFDDRYITKVRTVYRYEYPEAEVIFGVWVKEKQVVKVELSSCCL